MMFESSLFKIKHTK